jgi:hypothetical protein
VVKTSELNPNDPDACAKEMDRAKAMDRAFLMSKLFQAEYFYDIVAALNNTNKTKAFEIFSTICINRAELSKEQTTWLWNYLENYSPKYAWTAAVAPMNGW